MIHCMNDNTTRRYNISISAMPAENFHAFRKFSCTAIWVAVILMVPRGNWPMRLIINPRKKL